MTDPNPSEPSDEAKAIEFERDGLLFRLLVREHAQVFGVTMPRPSEDATEADIIAALAANPEAMAACADGLSRHTGELRAQLTEVQAELERVKRDAGRMHYFSNLARSRSKAEQDELNALMRKYPIVGNQPSPPAAVEAKPAEGSEVAPPDCPHGVGLCTSSCPRAMYLANPPGPRHGVEKGAPVVDFEGESLRLRCQSRRQTDRAQCVHERGHSCDHDWKEPEPVASATTEEAAGKSERGRCDIPSQLRGTCELEWGHAGNLHENGGDGFCARAYDDEHDRRKAALRAEAGSTAPAQEQPASPKLGGPVGAHQWSMFVDAFASAEHLWVQGKTHEGLGRLLTAVAHLAKYSGGGNERG